MTVTVHTYGRPDRDVPTPAYVAVVKCRCGEHHRLYPLASTAVHGNADRTVRCDCGRLVAMYGESTRMVVV